ncbi:hypothetical protein A2U01_0098286, partial [Trifolium medium]|nr:hypothetical protein [Trifolium medium]
MPLIGIALPQHPTMNPIMMIGIALPQQPLMNSMLCLCFHQVLLLKKKLLGVLHPKNEEDDIEGEGEQGI